LAVFRRFFCQEYVFIVVTVSLSKAKTPSPGLAMGFENSYLANIKPRPPRGTSAARLAAVQGSIYRSRWS
jgi:hypothetical protein